MGKNASIGSPGTQIVHSYSPRAHFVRKLAASLAIVVCLTLATLSALVAVRGLWPQSAPEPPTHATRVVNVDVQP